MLTLDDLDRSGDCNEVRLLLWPRALEYRKVAIDANAGENRTAAFLAPNLRDQLPVLDDGKVLWDSTAILVYLPAAHGADGRRRAMRTRWRRSCSGWRTSVGPVRADCRGGRG